MLEKGIIMKHAVTALFAILLGSVILAAQSPDQKPTKGVVIQGPTGNTACPVAMHARQGMSGDILAVNDSRHKGTAQLLHLILSSGDSRVITGGEVTVHGLSGKSRITRTFSTEQDSSDAVPNLPVKFSAGNQKNVVADLWVPGMTTVHAIELNSITYADGSTWKFLTEKACRTIPDPTMLISGH
jgi:hypothetical protein